MSTGASPAGTTPATGQGGTPETGQQSQQQPAAAAEGETPKDFEAWLAKQPDAIKTLHESHTSGLKSALATEREARKEMERQLRELAKKADEGSPLRQQIDKLSADVAKANARAAFVDAAVKAGATSGRLAYLAAQDHGLLRDDGSADFEALKAKEPALFARPAVPTPPANVGNGANGQGAITGPAAINAWLRHAVTGR